MDSTRSTRILTRYNRWANDVIFEAVAALPQGEATKPRPSIFRNMIHTLNHNYVIDSIFKGHLEGREHGYSARNTPEHPPLEALRRDQRALDNWYIEWSDAVTPEALNEKVSFKFVGGGEGAMTRAEMIMHVVNHTSYHRGFVGQMLFEVPVRAPTTDLTVFLRDAAPDF
jgi:uncharacterized damage-inducible protein DinB